MELPDGVVAYYLLDCANLTQEQASLCRATCSKLGYTEMKTQIERVSISPNTGTSPSDQIEPQFIAQSYVDDYEQD